MCASKPWTTLAALLLGLTLSLGASAQNAPSREQEMLRRLRQQTQELQQQLAAQQAAEQDKLRKAGEEQAAAKAQADRAHDELKRLRSAAAAQTRNAAALQESLDALRAEHVALQQSRDALSTDLAQRNASIAELQKARSQLSTDLAQQRDTLAQLQARHRTQAQGLQTCIASNKALHQLGNELLSLYANKGVSDVFAHREPFVQTRRVQLENLLEDYQLKLDQLALPATAAANTSSQAAPSDTAAQR